MVDGYGILHSSPRIYFLLGSIIPAKDFNSGGGGEGGVCGVLCGVCVDGLNSMFWEMVTEEGNIHLWGGGRVAQNSKGVKASEKMPFLKISSRILLKRGGQNDVKKIK